MQRVQTEPIAGELSALLLESHWIKQRFPLLNRAQRASRSAYVIDLSDAEAAPRMLPIDSVPPALLAGHYGPFKDRRAARSMLQRLANECGLCWTMLGLEARVGPCFARQVRKCAGACVGAEQREAHQSRLREALAPWRLPEWPYDGPVVIREQDATAAGPHAGGHLHLVDHWCHLGTVRDSEALRRLAAEPPKVLFDADIFRLLHSRIQAKTLEVGPVAAPLGSAT